MSKKLINYQQFLEGYKTGEITVLVNNSKAGDFVMSKFGDKHNKPAHLFWTWLGILLIFPAPIIFWVQFGWVHALGSFVLGLMLSAAARKSASQFVLQNMIESEDFWDYVLLHKGAIIQDEKGNEIGSEFLDRMSKKYGEPRDLQKTEAIVHEYGKIQEKVAQEIMTKYPAVVFPKSLLPYPKERIQKALEEALRYTGDEKMAENIKSCAVFLENFIEDEEANKRNNDLLDNKEYQKAIKKHSQKKNKGKL